MQAVFLYLDNNPKQDYTANNPISDYFIKPKKNFFAIRKGKTDGRNDFRRIFQRSEQYLQKKL